MAMAMAKRFFFVESNRPNIHDAWFLVCTISVSLFVSIWSNATAYSVPNEQHLMQSEANYKKNESQNPTNHE